MKKPDPLWWEIFITEYLQNGQNAVRAMMKAKPHIKSSSAACESDRLFKNAKFCKVIAVAQKKASKQIQMTHEDWLKELERVGKSKCTINSASKLKALELIAKSNKWINEKIEHSGNVTLILEHPYSDDKES